MCSTAADSDGTTDAGATSTLTARPASTTAGDPCTVTPASRSAGNALARNASATSACTSTDSAALHTDGREVFALSRIDSAMSRSASAWTYTWQLPTPVSMTGTVDSSTTDVISDAPPR